MKRILLLLVCIVSMYGLQAQQPTWQGKFEPIDRMIAPPSPYRNASGAPGREYWQQRADYSIRATLDEASSTLSGEETITYYNNSPDDLPYIWVQLDQNVNRKENKGFSEARGNIRDSITTRGMQFLTRVQDFPAGYTIASVTDASGKKMRTIENNTMMKVFLESPLKSGTSMRFSIAWSYPVTDRSQFVLSREGYEYFPEDDNKVFLIAHWFPRMAVYNDTEGWQNKQFQKLGEFALEFGDYDVEISVPQDHVVAATGSLQNIAKVLSKEQQKRMQQARTSFDKPVIIITPEEATTNEKTKKRKLKTWKFKAINTRDFAFASSRKFIWDAQAVKFSDHTTMAMSFYPKEGLPVWTEESTKAVISALEVYSEATFEYPYPVAISVNTSNIGMEFPMISFNGGRPRNGTMSQAAKGGMIRTIVHEVGHNWFPMIVSSDERQWMWMDEGLNTYLDQKTMAEKYPQHNNITPKDIVPYMSGDQSIMRPIMTSSDNEMLSQIGANFYNKPTIGLQILRNSVIGPELFDQAFKEYANRWKYKHPNPGDLFRTLEDATATDLDWFYRGWFFTTDVSDVELANVKWFKVLEKDIKIEESSKKVALNIKGDATMDKKMDFSNGPQEITMTDTPDRNYGGFQSRLDDGSIRKELANKNIYELTLKNVGGLIMPVTIEWTYTDGTTEIERLPAEIWRLNEAEIQKTFVKDKEVTTVTVDPNFEFADIDTENNTFPRKEGSSKFDELRKKQ